MNTKNNVANDIRRRILTETRKRPEKMDMSLILDGLNSIDPFDAEADTVRARNAFADFVNRYDLANTDRRAPVRRHRVSLVTAVILLLGAITGVCCALGFNIWNVTALWDNETLNMWLEPADEASATYLKSPSNRTAADVWGNALYDLMEEHGISAVLPTWMPEKLQVADIKYSEQTNGSSRITASYLAENGEHFNLVIRELLTQEIPNYLIMMEADDSLQETIQWNGNEYYISSNLENTTVTWVAIDKSIQISGSIERSEIENLIKSMEAVSNEKD